MMTGTGKQSREGHAMRFCLGTAMVLLVATLVGAGNEEAESQIRELVTTIKELTATMERVKDAKTAKVAQPHLLVLGNRVEKLNEILKGATEAEKRRLLEKYGKELVAVSMPLLSETQRVAKLPGVEQVLKDVPFFRTFREQEQARRERVKSDLRTLSLAVDAFKAKYGIVPNGLEDLTEGEQPL